MRIYTLTFSSGHRLPSVWFNFDIDTLYLDWGHDNTRRNARRNRLPYDDFFFDEISERSKVKNLAISAEGNLQQPDHWHDRILKAFGNVRSLTFVQPLPRIHQGGSELVFLDDADVAERAEFLPTPKSRCLHPTLNETFHGCSFNYSPKRGR